MKNKNINSQNRFSCAVCAKNIGDSEAEILEETESGAAFYAVCKKCGNSSITFMSAGQAGIIGFGVATDLERSEAREKFRQEAINADEVIDAYQHISNCAELAGFVKNIKD